MNPVHNQGYVDYWNDVLLTECPYNGNEGLSYTWRQGWWEAYWEDYYEKIRSEPFDKAQ